jgi:hypothetical protein
MKTLHTFGCSITQGFALPDVVRPLLDSQGQPLPPEVAQQRIEEQRIPWTDIHLYQPSNYAWPQVLGDQLGMTVRNHARRGSCFQQIARQCAVEAASIQPDDTVIVMWTYMSRVSLQWPARTAVPLTHLVDTGIWRTYVKPGFNKLFGVSVSDRSHPDVDERIYTFIHNTISI